MIHHVFANKTNIGDWLSARGMQRLLGPHHVVEHFCDDPFVAQTLDELARLDERDLVVIGGGGLLMDYFEPFWRGLLGLSPRLRWCLWGVGFCDLKAEPSHPPLELVRAVVAGSELCVVRDELTRGLLAEPSVGPPVACPTLCEIEPLPPGRGVLHVDNYTSAGAAAFETMDAACRRYAAATDRPYRRTNNRVGKAREGELARCLELYAQSDLVVSSALHGCIIGVAMGRPVLAVSGDRKIEGFMQAAGLGDWVLDHTRLERLEPMIARLVHQPSAHGFVERTRAANRAVAQRIAALSAAGTALEAAR